MEPSFRYLDLSLEQYQKEFRSQCTVLGPVGLRVSNDQEHKVGILELTFDNRKIYLILKYTIHSPGLHGPSRLGVNFWSLVNSFLSDLYEKKTATFHCSNGDIKYSSEENKIHLGTDLTVNPEIISNWLTHIKANIPHNFEAYLFE